MRKSIIPAFMILAFFASALLAAPKPVSDPVQKALKDRYPDAKVQVMGTREVNGVKITDAKVTTKEGESTAEVTEFGDFLLYGLPRKGGLTNISKPAADVISGLFKGTPGDVDVYWVSDYLIDLGVGNKSFRLRFDPVGRLRDIDNSAAIKESDISSMTKASSADATKAEGLAKKYYPDAKLNNVYNTEEAGFFLVDLTNKEGKPTQIILSNENRVLDRRELLNKDDLPKPVAEAIDRLFNGEKIKKVYRDEFEYYQIDQKDASGDAITIKVRPNGDVLNVRNMHAMEEEKAQTAKHKESASGSKKKGD